MPAVKSKRIRLIDLLGNIEEQERVRLISPRYRIDAAGASIEVEENFKKLMTTLVEGITVEGGILTIYII